MSMTLNFLKSLKYLDSLEFKVPKSFRGYEILVTNLMANRVTHVEKWDRDYVWIRCDKTGSTIADMPKELFNTKFLKEMREHVQKKFRNKLKVMIKKYRSNRERDDILDSKIIRLIRKYLNINRIDSYLNEYMQIIQIGCLRVQNLKF